MRSNSLSKSMGLMVTVLALGACGGGDADVDPVEEGPAAEAPAAPEAPAAAAPSATPAAGGSALVAAGQQVFTGQGLCFTCHGQEGQGTPLAPNLTDDEWLNIENPDGDLVAQVTQVVRAGVAQPHEHPAPMPPMGGAQLTDEQLNSVVAYVVSLSS